MLQTYNLPHPHAGVPVLTLGAKPGSATSAMLLLHGRGASAHDILGLGSEFDLPKNMLVLAPQASNSLWYPQRLTAPVEANEPYLSSALRRISELVDELEGSGIPAERIIIGGFSQGASLSSEFVLRNPRRWGGLLAFSGAYIGQMGLKREPGEGDLAGTPVFMGCSDVDPFIPLERIEASVRLLTAMGANVTSKIYPGMDHTICLDEIQTAQAIVSALA